MNAIIDFLNDIFWGYILIYGGWKNTRHVVARRDEHGKDRLELALDGATPRSRPGRGGAGTRRRSPFPAPRPR